MKFRSTRVRLQQFLTLIIALLIFSFSLNYLSGMQQRAMEQELIDQQQLVSKIFQNLEKVQNLLEKYMKTGDLGDYRQFIKSYPIILKLAHQIEEYPRNEEAGSHVIDFQYQLQTYIEEANTAVSYRLDDELILANEHFVETIRLVLIIQNNFKNIFTVIMMDMEGLQTRIDNTARLNLIVHLVVVFIISILFILFFSSLIRTLAKPIEDLTKAAQKVAEGDMNIEKVPEASDDELRILAQAFNTMVTTIKGQIEQLSHQRELEKRLYKEEMSIQKMDSIIKETELKALQAQINPHFFFNTLNMIKQMAYLESSEKTSKLLEALSSMLRYNLDGFNKTVSLEEELQNLEDYLFIQKLRFEDRILFTLEKEISLSSIKIPCLILQPLVENAIIHGMKETLENGSIKIRIHRENERYSICVTDNGSGISVKRQKEIQSWLEKNNNSKEHGIGLSNVFNRLKLFYKDNMDFTIASIPGQGSEIRLDLPLLLNEEGIS